MDEIFNEEIIKELCEKYNFQYKVIGGRFIEIKSLKDTWYIKNAEFNKGKQTLRLLHANIYGSGGYHYQGSFKNFEHMFEYVHKHDYKEYIDFNKGVF